MSSSGLGFGFRRFLRARLRTLPANLHWAFLLIATPLVAFLALWTPPFQSPDEPAHFDRAYQVSHGRFYASYGGNIDAAIELLYQRVYRMPFHTGERFTAADQMGAEAVTWTGRLEYRPFPNSGICPATGYLPQSLGIAFGQLSGMSVMRTLQLARLLNGAFALFVCALALSWCRGGKVVMFALLLMPMTLSLFGSCGQDATLIALTCLALSLVSKQVAAGTPLTPAQTAVLAVSLLVVSLGRPPYTALLLILLTPGLLNRWQNRPSWLPGSCLALLLTAATLAWWVFAYASAGVLARPYTGYGVVEARTQIVHIIHHPGIVVSLAGYAAVHWKEYFVGMVGMLGWLETLMPALYYLAMVLVLLTACIAELAHGGRVRKSVTAMLLGSSIAAGLAVFLVEYLIWTPVGATGIYGVQGRYFIPVAIAAAVALPSLIDSYQTYERATAMVVLAQLLTVAVLPHVILARYYSP